MRLTLDTDWLRRGFEPSSLTQSPFEELPATPAFPEVYGLIDYAVEPFEDNLIAYGEELRDVLVEQLDQLPSNLPVHLLMSGGYDSRALAALLWRRRRDVLFVMDGTQEPSASRTLDYLDVPAHNRYVHDLSQPDPYRLTTARCDGWAPIYTQLDFFPHYDDGASLVAGLGGGEWFSYPAANWHGSKKPRTSRSSVIELWLDCWPQYALLPKAWARSYGRVLYPYCTTNYAMVAQQCRPEWMREGLAWPTLDYVRKSLLDSIDLRLKTLGWEPHRYDFRLDAAGKAAIDVGYKRSWLARRFSDTIASACPSLMTKDDWACTMGGFAQWCDDLIAEGHEIVVA